MSGGNFRVGYYKLASASARVFRGDAVRLIASTGLATRWVSTSNNVLGVALRDSGVPATGGIAQFPISDDPNTVYQVQIQNTGAITQALFGGNYKVVCTTGDTSTGASKMRINTTSAATASNVVRAIRLALDVQNDLSQYSLVEVVLDGDPTKNGRAVI
jgi:hypothetical protein